MATAATATSTSLTCISVPPNEHGHVSVGACGAIWPYHPSFDSNLAIVIIFAVSTLAHAVQSLFFRQVRTSSQSSRSLRLEWLRKLIVCMYVCMLYRVGCFWLYSIVRYWGQLCVSLSLSDSWC
ncbi:hypothetical protein DER44DRAFT_123821 [Fusarium oxysporum]|nr:hypothetical protein DER44DRAFT_123821 [Fusarium oxysporum]